MPELQASEKIVEVLHRQGLLTGDQARRVRQAVDSGKDLVWALSHLPLVEPLQFLKAQSQAGTSPGTRGASTSPVSTPSPTSTPPTYELKPLPEGPDTPTPLPIFAPGADGELNFAGLDEEEEDVPTLEIEDKDYAEGFEGVGRPMDPSHTPLPESPEISPHTPMPHHRLSGGTPNPSSPTPESFARPGVSPSTYDLSDDEGIALVNRVNALLAEALAERTRRVVLRPVPAGMEIASISELGTEGVSRPLEPDEGAKIANRIKIMARIEPWRKPPQKGMFNVQHQRRQGRVLVDILESPDAPGTEEITLHFIPTF